MKIARIRGIDVILNDFFVLLLLAYGMLGVLSHAFIIFGLVLIHELAHGFVAGRLGLKVKEIELYPFGGVARIEGLLELEPAQEIKVALAGPLSNFLLLVLGYYCHWRFHWHDPYYALFQKANLTMGLFNLLPALPLDGGRVLRAYWAKKKGLSEATWQAALWGRYGAVVLLIMGTVGLLAQLTDLSLLLVAAFIYVAAAKYEEGAVYLFLRYLLHKNKELATKGVLPLRQLAVTPKTKIKDVLPKFSPGTYHVIHVLDQEGKVKGQVTEHQLLRALFQKGASYPFEEILKI